MGVRAVGVAGKRMVGEIVEEQRGGRRERRTIGVWDLCLAVHCECIATPVGGRWAYDTILRRKKEEGYGNMEGGWIYIIIPWQ